MPIEYSEEKPSMLIHPAMNWALQYLAVFVLSSLFLTVINYGYTQWAALDTTLIGFLAYRGVRLEIKLWRKLA